MKRSSSLGLRLFTSAFLILFTFAQPLLAIESLIPVQDAASTESVVTDIEEDILDEGISDPEEIAKPTWVTSGESASTSSPVVVGETYTYPINPAVTVTFSELPTVASTLTIKTIYLTDDQVKATNAASDVAYDITTDMTDGTFEYDLTLPKVGDNNKVIYAENISGLLNDSAKDIKNVVENGSFLKLKDLNHFTIFVIIDDGDADFTAPGWSTHGSGYNGDHAWITPAQTNKTATWTYTGPDVLANSYAIFISWTQWDDHATNAEYFVTSSSSPLVINQKLNSRQIVTDGNGVWSGWYRAPATSLPLLNADPVFITTNSLPNGNLSADAVAFVDLNEAPMTVWVDDNYSYNNAGYHFWEYDAFNNLQSALDAVADGGTVVLESNLQTLAEININKSVVLNGNNHIIYSEFTKTDNSNNSALGIFSDDVTINNLSIDGTDSTNLHGINIYVAQNILLDNVTAQNNDRAGIVVNGSTVTVNNVTTSNNTWGGINVDQGTGVTTVARLTVQGISHHTESTAIWIDDTTKDILVTDTNLQYAHVDSGNLRVYFLDNTAPTVPINGLPHNTIIPTNDFYFTWDASTDLSPITYEFQASMNPAEVGGVLTTNVWHSPSPLPTPTIHSTGAPDGTWYWQVRAMDSFGNYSAWSTIWNVTLDTQAPATPILVSPFDGAYVNGASVTNVWSDTSTDVASYNYESYNDEDLTSLRWSQTFTTTSKTATSVADATFWWRVQAVDTAGNKSAWSDAWKVTVDSTKPSTIFSPDLSGQSFNSGIVIEGASTDINGVHAVNLYYRVSGTSDWTLITTLTDTDATPYYWSYTWTPDNDGVFDVRASGVDLAGNAEESPIITGITFDTVLPTIGDVNIVVDYLSQYVNGQTGFLMFVPVNDSFSGIDDTSCMYTLDGGTWSNGTFVGDRCRFGVSSSQLFDNDGLEISAKVSDLAGNTVISNIVERTVDKNLPTSQTIIDEIYYGPNSLPEIKGTATDTVSDVTNVMFSLRRNSDGKYWIAGNMWMNVSTPLHNTSGTDTWTYTQILPTLRNNVTYTVTPYAWDQVHLATQAGTPDAFVWDNELPQDPNSFRAYPDANIPTNDNTVDVYFSGESDSMSGVAGFYYSFSNTQETPDLTNWLTYEQHLAVSTPLADGIWWFNIRTIDNAGNITSTIHYGPFIIDTTPATISWNAPLDGSIHNGPVVLSATSNETMNNFRFVWKRAGDSSWTQGLNNNNQQTTYEYTFDPIFDGVYTLRAQGRDLAINWSKASPDIEITIDKTAPRTPDKLKFEKPDLLCGGITNSYTITAVWDDNGDNLSGVKEFIYFVDTPGVQGWTTRVSATQRPGQFNQGEGVYTFKVKAVDNAGNVSEWSDPCSVTYDATAPDVEITAPTSTHLTGIVEIRGTVTDVNPHHYWFVITNSIGTQVAGLGTVNDTTSFTDKFLLNWDTTSLPEGNYTIKLEARDAAGNKDSGSVHWLVVTVDHTQPTVDLQLNVSDTGFEAVFSEDVNRADAENAANYFLNNWPTAGGTGDLLGDASISYDSVTHTATVTFTDGGWYISPEQQWGVQDIHDLAGNILAVTPYTEYSTPMVDPVTSVSGIDSLWHNTDVTVTLTCTDVDGSGCYKTYYSLNGINPYVEGNTVVVSQEGLNTLDFYSTDRAGNTENEQTADLIKIDKTDPTADVLAALTFTTGDNTPRSLALSDNNELAQVCYVIDTNTQTCLPLFGTGYSWDISALINTLGVGAHTFTYYVVDTAGNRSDSDSMIDGSDPYASSVIVAAIPQDTDGEVQGETTRNNTFAVTPVTTEQPQEEETPAPEEIITDDTEEVQGTQDTATDDTGKQVVQWWVYALGGTAFLSFLIFLIARRRRKENEY